MITITKAVVEQDDCQSVSPLRPESVFVDLRLIDQEDKDVLQRMEEIDEVQLICTARLAKRRGTFFATCMYRHAPGSTVCGKCGIQLSAPKSGVNALGDQLGLNKAHEGPEPGTTGEEFEFPPPDLKYSPERTDLDPDSMMHWRQAMCHTHASKSHYCEAWTSLSTAKLYQIEGIVPEMEKWNRYYAKMRW